MSCHSNSHNDTSGLWESNPRSNSLCKSWLFPLSHCWQMVNWVNGHRSFWGTIVAHTFCSVARSFLLRTQPPLQSLGPDMKIASSLVTEQELSFLLWLHLTPLLYQSCLFLVVDIKEYPYWIPICFTSKIFCFVFTTCCRWRLFGCPPALLIMMASWPWWWSTTPDLYNWYISGGKGMATIDF